ncbi:MAG TPA: type II toxin-antitoxin system Phd/YefM family antitoxin [Tepidisphaeraceae bacterium]|nr:type II toxin-antitoxin system Phd/YefM family antitoxin [Tepidisphaeraceae bacterium]
MIIHRAGGEDVALVSASELNGIAETAHLLRSPRNKERLLRTLKRAKCSRANPHKMNSGRDTGSKLPVAR